jgi:hypothetical protein
MQLNLILAIIALFLAYIAVRTYKLNTAVDAIGEHFAFSPSSVQSLCEQQAKWVASSPYLSHKSKNRVYRQALQNCLEDAQNPDTVMPSAYITA